MEIPRAVWALLIAIPIWFGLSLLCYIAFCLTLGPWGGAMDLVDPQDVPWYLPWLNRALTVLLVLVSLWLGWRMAPRLQRT